MTEEEFQRAKWELEQFLALALHDLRSALNSSTTLAQIVARRFSDDLGEEGRWIAGQIVTQQKRMGDLITGIWAFIDATKSKEGPKAVELESAICAALYNLRMASPESPPEVRRETLPTVFGYERQLVEVFQNLISNAVRYRGAAPQRITITATCDGASCTVCVRDNRIGFAPEFREQIFELFRRLHGNELPGAGLGLSICRKIVEAHGGRIWAESEAGQETTFYVQLPPADRILKTADPEGDR